MSNMPAPSWPASGPRPPYSWTPEETRTLVFYYENGASVDSLHVLSGRSPHHVVAHLSWVLLGVGRGDVNPLAPRFREPWSESEDDFLDQHVGAGEPLGAIAEALGRDLTDVASRIITYRVGVRAISQAG